MSSFKFGCIYLLNNKLRHNLLIFANFINIFGVHPLRLSADSRNGRPIRSHALCVIISGDSNWPIVAWLCSVLRRSFLALWWSDLIFLSLFLHSLYLILSIFGRKLWKRLLTDLRRALFTCVSYLLKLWHTTKKTVTNAVGIGKLLLLLRWLIIFVFFFDSFNVVIWIT